MPKEPIITRVADNMERQFTYRENITRFNKAMKDAFYYEALLIDGALIEDRIRSFLYGMGVFESREDRKAFGGVKRQVRAIQNAHLGKESGLRVDMLSYQILVIRATANWYLNDERTPEAIGDKYLEALWKQFDERINVECLLDALDRIDEWREYRNEVIHGLLNKSVSSLDAELPQRCQAGFDLFREMDAYVAQLSYGNRIRRAARLSTEKGR